MKILFIQPKLNVPSNIKNRIFQLIEEDQFSYLHLSIYYLVSITPEDYSIKIIDERFSKLNFNEDCDILVITFSTLFAPRAYEIADIFRKKGKTVILGGSHTTLVPDEAKNHADSILIGETDIIWIELLNDVKEGKLKSLYKAEKLVEPENIKKVRFNLSKKLLNARVEASRGCYNCCHFCLAPIILGEKQRVRPIKDIVSEIKLTKSKVITFDDSSLTLNPDYTKLLFKELKLLKKNFFCCGNVNVLNKDYELLKLAKEAGCIGWFIGFESFDQTTLKSMGKKTNKVEEYKKVVENIHSNGMAVIGSFMFGFDEDDSKVFDSTLNIIKDLGLDSANFNILGIYPGTPFFKNLEKDGRILTKDWTKHNFSQVYFKPMNMSKEELEKETYRIAMEYYSISNIFRISLKTIKLGFYPFISLLIRNLTFRQFYKAWETIYSN